MKQPIEKLKDKLSELFQLDQADLDFGIYRIMNARRAEITHFLEKDLLPQIKDAFSIYKSADKTALKADLDKAIEGAKSLGVDPDTVPKVRELQSQYDSSHVDLTALENEVYSRLYDFFNRYYDNGDFISMRRYKKDVYAIPYEGEEVKLHWANADQYYIKTTEYFRDYAFRVNGKKLVHFKIVEADTEKDNIKAANGNDRRFFLSDDKPVSEEKGELIIRFEYRTDPQKRRQEEDLNAETIRRILVELKNDKLAKWEHPLTSTIRAGKNLERTILEKHLADYTKRNTFDYFIHKDLGGFLRRELDFYIKNEIMHLDDVENESAPRVEQYLSKIKVIRKIAHKIIDFLAQIEDFQKKLWLKKKFVIETNYCITLDRVPEELYPEIAANKAQHDEWVKLFAIDEIERDLINPGYSKLLTVKFLKANPFLVLDTKFFSQKFKDKLLVSFDDVEGKCDGLLIHSENFQALNLLQERYQEKVKCIYIDPPYNTSASEIIYKNSYKSSSWLTHIENRLNASKLLLDKAGMLCVTIDDFEFHKLREIISTLFGEENIAGVVAIKNNPSGRSTVKGFSIAHEYGIFAFASEHSRIGMLPRTEEQLSQYKESDESGQFQWRSFLRSGGANDVRSARPKLYYPLIVSGDNLSIPELRWDEQRKRWLIVEKITEPHQIIYPIRDGIEYTWRLGIDTLKTRLNDIRIRKSKNGKHIIEIKFHLDEEGVLPKTVWDEKSMNASAYGTTLLRHIMGVSQIFSFPKSIHAVQQSLRVCDAGPQSLVLDYFSGSGTTGHAVINLNREDGGKRKYILVEMGDYFDTVLKPRIAKVVYSENWKDGKPTKRESGISHCFKYIRLESYEDTLANLELKSTDAQKALLDLSDSFRESYMLKYMIDTESSGSQSLLNIDAFEDPFNYKLLVGAGSVGETRTVNVDLVETFNWLLGLRVRHMDHIRGFRVIEGMSPENEKVLIIWRNIKEKSNEALDDFFRKQQYNTMDMEFDVIYVNGDNNLMNLPVSGAEGDTEPRYKVRLIEEEFKRLMFDVKDV